MRRGWCNLVTPAVRQTAIRKDIGVQKPFGLIDRGVESPRPGAHTLDEKNRNRRGRIRALCALFPCHQA